MIELDIFWLREWLGVGRGAGAYGGTPSFPAHLAYLARGFCITWHTYSSQGLGSLS